MAKRMWLWWLVLVVLAGCGGGSAKSGRAVGSPVDSRGAASAPSVRADATAGPASESPAGFSGGAPEPAPASAPPAPARSRGESSASIAPEPPRDRPGLGTEWGETRESRVHDVSFTRADGDRPFAVAQLFYNDRRGVEAQAQFHARTAERRRALSAGNGAISVAIHDGTGDALDAVRMGDRTYVVGESGARYTIVLTNHTGHRFEAVATVDGLDVINGRAGALENRGYVLMPFGTLEIDGFRQSQDAVAAFRFAPVGESYAAQTGTARNVGVIGVAFFAEAGDVFPAPWTDAEVNRRETASPFPADPRFARPPR